MNRAFTHIVSVGLILAAFAVVATSLVALTESKTHNKISENERQTLLMAINAVVDHNKYNNDILMDTVTLPATQQLGTNKPTTVYRARMNQEPVAAILTAIAPNGYSGKIKLLVAVYSNGDLAGVRVIKHKETPGLGDKIDVKKADWILQFEGLSLRNPNESKWAVKKDGGDFDQFTGATITPRAIVTAVKKVLYYFEQHSDALFAIREAQ